MFSLEYGIPESDDRGSSNEQCSTYNSMIEVHCFWWRVAATHYLKIIVNRCEMILSKSITISADLATADAMMSSF